MEVKENNSAYNPLISEMASGAILRISWALNCNMYQALDEIISFLPQPRIISKVCKACKDKSACSKCVFNNKNTPQSALSTITNGIKYSDYFD